MKEITPISTLNATVVVPGSKYIANRVLLMAALADGTSVIRNVVDNNDITATLDVLNKLGVECTKEGSTVTVIGTGGKLVFPEEALNVTESGTLMRFLTAFCSLGKGDVTITGSERIQQRPVTDLLDALQSLGVQSQSQEGCAPVTLTSSGLEGGTVHIKGEVSSQYLSALLIVASYAQKDVEIVVDGELVSKKYVDLTLDLMSEFGVEVARRGYQRFVVEAGQQYTARDYHISGDWSSANYFLAAAALVPGKVTVKGVDTDSSHGERGFVEVLKTMGCTIEDDQSSITVTGPEKLFGVEVNMSSMPDSVQTLAALAPFAKSHVTMTGISHLKHKESDRIGDTANEWAKLGIKVETTEHSMDVYPSPVKAGIVESHNDHRMAMSLALLGLKVPGIHIQGPDAVKKSFPGFWDTLASMDVEIKDV